MRRDPHGLDSSLSTMAPPITVTVALRRLSRAVLLVLVVGALGGCPVFTAPEDSTRSGAGPRPPSIRVEAPPSRPPAQPALAAPAAR
jgi:hypothetical protein